MFLILLLALVGSSFGTFSPVSLEDVVPTSPPVPIDVSTEMRPFEDSERVLLRGLRGSSHYSLFMPDELDQIKADLDQERFKTSPVPIDVSLKKRRFEDGDGALLKGLRGSSQYSLFTPDELDQIKAQFDQEGFTTSPVPIEVSSKKRRFEAGDGALLKGLRGSSQYSLFTPDELDHIKTDFERDLFAATTTTKPENRS